MRCLNEYKLEYICSAKRLNQTHEDFYDYNLLKRFMLLVLASDFSILYRQLKIDLLPLFISQRQLLEMTTCT